MVFSSFLESTRLASNLEVEFKARLSRLKVSGPNSPTHVVTITTQSQQRLHTTLSTLIDGVLDNCLHHHGAHHPKKETSSGYPVKAHYGHPLRNPQPLKPDHGHPHHTSRHPVFGCPPHHQICSYEDFSGKAKRHQRIVSKSHRRTPSF